MGNFLPTKPLAGFGKNTFSIINLLLIAPFLFSSCQKMEDQLAEELSTSTDFIIHHSRGQTICDHADARYIIDLLNHKKQFDSYTIKFTEASRLNCEERWNRILGTYLDSWNENSLSLAWRQVAGVDSFEVAERAFENGIATTTVVGKLALGEEGVFFLYKLHAMQVSEVGQLIDQPGHIVSTLAEAAPQEVSYYLE